MNHDYRVHDAMARLTDEINRLRASHGRLLAVAREAAIILTSKPLMATEQITATALLAAIRAAEEQWLL